MPDPLLAVCPRCKAGPGDKCKDYRGRGTAPHRERKKLADPQAGPKRHGWEILHRPHRRDYVVTIGGPGGSQVRWEGETVHAAVVGALVRAAVEGWIPLEGDHA